MQSGLPSRTTNPAITLLCDESSSFNRHLLSLVRQWDKTGNVRIVCGKDMQADPAQSLTVSQLCVSDQNGGHWYGAEAVPIIFKNLPFGKLAAAMYILPGTMWFTKQIYALDKTIEPSQVNDRGH
jgi:hypothetical protein